MVLFFLEITTKSIHWIGVIFASKVVSTHGLVFSKVDLYPDQCFRTGSGKKIQNWWFLGVRVYELLGNAYFQKG